MLDQKCSNEHLTDISRFLDWRGVTPYLGLDDIDRRQIESKTTEHEKGPETLRLWKKKYGFKTKFKILVVALLKIGNAEQAEKVCKSTYINDCLYFVIAS